MNKYLGIVLFLLSLNSAFSSELCAGTEIKIVEDMRISEDNIEQEYANRAKEILKTLDSGTHSELNYYEKELQRLNAEKILKGYELKLAAKNSRESEESSSPAITEYCSFISTKAFWHD